MRHAAENQTPTRPALRGWSAAGAFVAAMAAMAGAAHAARPEPVYLIILGRPETFASALPRADAGSVRQVGWGAVLYPLKTPAADLQREVEEACDTTERTGYPLLLHLDDWNFPPPSTDPAWVEWTAFPAAGERAAPLVRRRWLNWGSWITTGPPPNYASPKVRALLRERIGEGVARPLAARLARWRREGRADLLAGVVVGWESGYYTMPRPEPRPTAGAETFGDDEMVTTGYAALTQRGYTAGRLRREAIRRRMPEPALFRELMTRVVRDYVAYLCGVCQRGGIPRSRIYTHFSPAITAVDAAVAASDGRMLPVSAAVNRFSRPGLTMTRGWANFDRVIADLGPAARTGWGAVEFEIVPDTRSEAKATAEIEWLEAHGARVMCLYGWWDPDESPFHVRGTGAVAAMQRWLRSAPPASPTRRPDP